MCFSHEKNINWGDDVVIKARLLPGLGARKLWRQFRGEFLGVLRRTLDDDGVSPAPLHQPDSSYPNLLCSLSLLHHFRTELSSTAGYRLHPKPISSGVLRCGLIKALFWHLHWKSRAGCGSPVLQRNFHFFGLPEQQKYKCGQRNQMLPCFP